MFVLNPLVMGSILIFVAIFLAGVAFWIVYGIKKFKWALVTSIVLSVLFVLSGGMLSLRIISPKAVVIVRSFDQFDKIDRIERAIDRTKLDIFKHKGVFGFRKFLLEKEGPEIKFEGINEEDIEQIKEHWDEIESITINVDVDVKYKEKE